MLIRWLLSVLINAVALLAVAQLFDSFHIENFGTAILASIVLSVLNILVKPLLILFTLPITVMTLGLFLFIVNALTLMLAQAIVGSTFVIEGFGTAIIASIVISLISLILNQVIKSPKR